MQKPTKSEIIFRNKKYIISLESKDRKILMLDEYITELRNHMKEAKEQIKLLNDHRNTIYDLWWELGVIKEELEKAK